MKERCFTSCLLILLRAMLRIDNVRSCYRVKRLISNPSLEKEVRSETRRKIRMRDQM